MRLGSSHTGERGDVQYVRVCALKYNADGELGLMESIHDPPLPAGKNSSLRLDIEGLSYSKLTEGSTDILREFLEARAQVGWGEGCSRDEGIKCV